MLKKLSNLLYTLTRGWLIAVVLVVLIGFIALTVPLLQAASGDVEGLDVRFYYPPEDAFAAVDAYTPTGRSALRTLYLTVDVVNPVLYTALLVLLVSWLFQRGFAPHSTWRLLNVFPIGAALCDLLESLSVVTMLTAYPNHPRPAAWLATLGTMGKNVFLFGSLGLILAGLSKVIANKFISPASYPAVMDES
jgi:hypothetical protein